MEEIRNQDVMIEANSYLFQSQINQEVETEKLEEKKFIENIEQPIKVYVKKDNKGNIIEVNSEIFIDNFDGWEFLDEGYGDKYALAQSHYFPEEKIEE